MSSQATDQAIEQARAHLSAGRLAEAERRIRQVLSAQPREPRALRVLGSIGVAVGRFADAAELFRMALAETPHDADLRHDFATALGASGRLSEAIVECRQALAIAPDLFDAYLTLGNLLRAQGNLEEALGAYRQAVALFPQRADAYLNPGAVLAELKRFDEAAELLRRAIELQPDYPQAHHNLGNVLVQLGQLPEAVRALRRAATLRPAYHATLYLLAGALLRLGEYAESVEICRQSIALQPNYAEGHLTLGSGLRGLGQLDEALGAYRRALALNPGWAVAHVNLANIQIDCGLIEQAIRSFRRAIACDPTFLRSFSSLLVYLNYRSSITSREIYHEHWLFNLTHAAILERKTVVHANDRSADRPLRIGYVSPDFRDHSTSFFSLPLLTNHDPKQFIIYCYADLDAEDEVTERFRTAAGVWRKTTGLSDEQVAAMVQNDRIDILVDLALHTSGGRPLLFARRPAPIQVTWLGYPGTTGLTAMNYRLTDAHIDPPGLNDAYYFEESVRLPDTALCYNPRTTNPAPNRLPALSAGHVTFGCLNLLAKVNEPTLARWAKALAAAPRSRLLMAAPRGSPRERIAAFFKTAGIDATRIEFLDRQPTWRQFMQVYHRIDISLDTFPWNGHTTSLESLWMGVPVVTLFGQRAISRAGLCYLSNLNLADLATDSPERYVQIAAELARDLPRLAKLREDLRQRMLNSALTDARQFAGHVESAYLQMWQRWIRNEPRG